MLEGETLWLNQKQLTELFGKAKGTISEHIKHIFEEGELVEHSVVRFFRTTATDGISQAKEWINKGRSWKVMLIQPTAATPPPAARSR